MGPPLANIPLSSIRQVTVTSELPNAGLSRNFETVAHIRAIGSALGVVRNLVVAVTDGKTFGRASGQWSVAEQPCRNTRALFVKVKTKEKQLCALEIQELNGVPQAP